MKRGDEFTDIRSQSQFCTELMLRLNSDIQKDEKGSWSGMANHTQKQIDIQRVRRELMRLYKMLNPWGKEE